MRISEAFPSKFLSAEDLEGKPADVTMDRVEMEPVGEGNDIKPVLYFSEFEKGMCLNRTNADRIAKLYGNETDEWSGRKIQVYPSECEFKGETVPCLRVRQTVPFKMTRPKVESPPKRKATKKAARAART